MADTGRQGLSVDTWVPTLFIGGHTILDTRAGLIGRRNVTGEGKRGASQERAEPVIRKRLSPLSLGEAQSMPLRCGARSVGNPCGMPWFKGGQWRKKPNVNLILKGESHQNIVYNHGFEEKYRFCGFPEKERREPKTHRCSVNSIRNKEVVALELGS